MADTPTTITVNGTPFELNHIDPAHGRQLFDALGKTGTQTDYQQLASQISDLARNFQSIVPAEELPAGKGMGDAVKDLWDQLTKNNGKLPEGSAPYLQKLLNTSLGQTLQNNAIVHAGKTAADVAGDSMSLMSGFWKGLNAPFKIWDAGKQAYVELGRAADGKFNAIGKEQADTIGAVFAANIYNQVDSPESPDATKRKEPGIGDTVAVGFSDYFVHALKAGWKFISGGFKDWSECWTSTDDHPGLTFAERKEAHANDEAQKLAREHAGDVLTQVDDIAGVQTKDFAKLVKDSKGAYCDNNGTFHTLQFVNGKPKDDVVKIDSQPLNGAKRMQDAASALVKNLAPDSKSNAVGEAAGLYTAASVGLVGVAGGKSFTRGVVGAMVGKNSTLMQKAESKMAEAVEQDAGTAKKFGLFKKAANPAEAEKLAKEAVELEAKAMVRNKAVSKGLVEFAEKEGGNWFTKSMGWCGRQLGVVTDKVVISSGEKVAMKFGAKAVPVVGDALMATGDVIDGVKAANNGDTKQVIRSSARVGTGLLGAMGATAASGAAIGVWFEGWGAAPGYIIGGIAGAVGYWAGAKYIGDAVVDGAHLKDKPVAQAPKNVEPDAGMKAAIIQQHIQTQAKLAGQTLAFSGATSSIGATHPADETKPQPKPQPAQIGVRWFS